MKEQDFIKQFEAHSLSPENFNHLGHIWIAWLYVRENDLGTATYKINKGIKSYAESLGANDKFHLTLTTAFTCAIKSRFQEGQTFEDFVESNQDLVNDAMNVISTHYSPEVLNTEQAKTTLIKPDREPFPEEYNRYLNFSKESF